MAHDFDDFIREPSIAHQCMHYNDEGSRCRAHAMYNEYMCYRHRDKSIPPVIENEPFQIQHLDDRAAIQTALAGVAARLACNRMDLRRAGLLVYTLQVASHNLSATPLADPSQPVAALSGQPDIQRTVVSLGEPVTEI